MGRPTTKVYELIHPAGELQGLPAYVGFGSRSWLPRWELRSYDGSKLGQFFRTLDACGLHPEASTRWLPSWPVPEKAAVRLVRERVGAIIRWAGGLHPDWLLNIRGRPPQPYHGRPVTRIRADGGLEHFASIYAAAAARGVRHSAIDWCLATGCTDRQGARWPVARVEAGVFQGRN